MNQRPSGRPSRKKIRRSVWMPCLLFAYLAAMTAFFAPRLIAEGEIVRLIVVFVSEVASIILLAMKMIND